ncbi:MAG: transcriptional regulator, BadM/Rrf2 family [Paenibacillus sp.]|jgi:Rrf2 family protein|nr:transcriptional regulator, BadM/Rrf2 family [Paenibacillus sp.]
MDAARKEAPNAKWFGYALQSLAILAIHNGVCPSCEIAVKMESQATLLRRIMAQLAKFHLVVAKEGRDGGYLLAKPADQITFADVYRALQLPEPLSQALLDSTSDGVFGKEMQCYFTKFAGEWQKRVIFELEQRTVADLTVGYK